MLKDSEFSRYASRRTHRTYAREFKAELVAACQVPGASIAAVAGSHGMNANVLHRWLKEHARSGCHNQHTLEGDAVQSVAASSSPLPAFIPVQLPAPIAAAAPDIKAEVRKAGLTMSITWPVSASADFASWAASIFK